MAADPNWKVLPFVFGIFAIGGGIAAIIAAFRNR